MSHLIWFSPLTSTLCPFALCCSFLLLKSFFFLVWCVGLSVFLWANWLWNVSTHDVWGFHFTRLCASHGPVDPLSCLCKCQNSISPQYATPKSVLWKHSVDLANLPSMIQYNALRQMWIFSFHKKSRLFCKSDKWAAVSHYSSSVHCNSVDKAGRWKDEQISPVMDLIVSLETVWPMRSYWTRLEDSGGTSTECSGPLVQV